jgi:hypothetical protein
MFALVVLLPSIAFARSEYLCRFDGQLRASCCCPAQAKQHDAPRPAAIQDVCCCTVIEGAPSRAQPATADGGGGSRSPLPVFIAPVAVADAVVAGAVSVIAPPSRSLAPPDCRRELFVRHCAFLL